MPFVFHQAEILENDSIFGKAAYTLEYHSPLDNTKSDSGIKFFLNGFQNYFQFFGWIMIPSFFIFFPIGIIILFKNMNFKKLFLLIWSIGISIPIIYQFAIPLNDTRFLILIYPVLIIVSLFFIERVFDKIKNKNKFLLIIIIFFITTSLIFLEIKSSENKNYSEIITIFNEIPVEVKVINTFYPNDQFLEYKSIPKNWNEFKNLFLKDRVEGESIRNLVKHDIKIITIQNQNSAEKFLESNKELTHLVIDENNKDEFLQKIFTNEQEFKNFYKIYDSKESGHDYQLKIFKILQ